MSPVFAHAGHWLVSIAEFLPVLIFVVLARMLGSRAGALPPDAPRVFSADLPIFASVLIAASAVLSLMTVIAIYREGGILKRLVMEDDVARTELIGPPNPVVRQEIEKISFALEMGNNVLLYLDDIQHTNPELLQKFISLCDAQRRMEGVWDGRTRTYDLRGKRFAVCMAGNPYTEAGQRFRVPDMLANRADVWNLGDVLSGRDELFALSYIENALTSNPVLAPLTTRSRDEIRLLARMAGGDDSVRPDRLDHPYSAVELEQIMAVLRKLLGVQQVVLAVNQAYIASAAQADASRTEPPFRLQGSYRNMNRLAERLEEAAAA